MGLIGHWKLDDRAASTVIVASTGLNGSLDGGDNTIDKTVSGPGGSLLFGLDLNGSDDSIAVTIASFGDGAPFSVSFWAKTDGATAGQDRYIGSSGANVPSIRKASDTTVTVASATANATFTVPAVGNTLWHHFLVTRTAGNSVRVFMDGVESSSGAQSIAGIFAFNVLARHSTNYFNGRLAQMKVYDTDESAILQALYQEGVSGSNPFYSLGSSGPAYAPATLPISTPISKHPHRIREERLWPANTFS